jgi:hypothetical protein
VNFADFPIALPFGGAVLLGTTDAVATSSSEVLLGRYSAAILAR